MKVSKTVLIIVDVILLVGIIVLLACFIANIYKVETLKYPYLKEIGENWKRAPIVDIVPGTNHKCPVGSELLIEDTWPGTKEGCFCSKGKNKVEMLSLEPCSDSQKGNGCKNVAPNSPMAYKIWRSRTLCVTRMTGNYLDLATVHKGKTCPKNTKNCGFADSLQNMLCIPVTQVCPINYLKIVDAGVLRIPGASSIGLEGNKNLHFSNQLTYGKMAEQIKVSDYPPCVDPIQNNNQRPPYPLLSNAKHTGCKTEIADNLYDYRYEYIDTFHYQSLMNENGITPAFSKLPLFNSDYVDHDTQLYARGYFGLNPTGCLPDVKKDYKTTNDIVFNFIDFKEHIHQRSGSAPFVFSLLVVLIIALILIIVKVVIHCINSEERWARITQFCLTIAIFVFLLVAIILTIIQLVELLQHREEYLWVVSSVACTDPLTAGLIFLFDKDYWSICVIAIVIFLIALLLLILIVIMECLVCCDKENKEELFNRAPEAPEYEQLPRVEAENVIPQSQPPVENKPLEEPRSRPIPVEKSKTIEKPKPEEKPKPVEKPQSVHKPLPIHKPETEIPQEDEPEYVEEIIEETVYLDPDGNPISKEEYEKYDQSQRAPETKSSPVVVEDKPVKKDSPVKKPQGRDNKESKNFMEEEGEDYDLDRLGNLL